MDRIDEETIADVPIPKGAIVSIVGDSVPVLEDEVGPDAVDALDEARYDVKQLLGQGAEGRVYLAKDSNLCCPIAMKVLRPDKAHLPDAVRRFVREARVTSSLQHSGVPAVHELAYSENGELYFTMRLVQGRTLRDVLRGLRKRPERFAQEWTLIRLVQVLQQVANTVHYAHTKGLVHRDLKPANIALGDFREVLVLDWGLSKRIGADPDVTGEIDLAVSGEETRVGVIKGTPAYMAPEQALGDIPRIGPRTDVFSLGAILYEILYRRLPYEGRTAEEMITCAQTGRIHLPGESVAGFEPPPGLVATARRALSVRQEDRHSSALELAEELQAFLEGRQEEEWRRAEAQSLLSQACDFVERSDELSRKAARMELEVDRLRAAIPPWASEEDKRPLWELEDSVRGARLAAEEAYTRASDATSRALAQDPTNAAARELMARFYFERFLEAEREGKTVEASWLRRKVLRFNDGALDEVLRDTGGVAVLAEPDGATVRLSRFVETRRRLVEEEAHQLGVSPTASAALPMGSYALHVRKEGHAEARMPFLLQRGEQREFRIVLPRLEDVPDGFVWIPAGPFIEGVSPDQSVRELPDYLIGKRPVLLREYALWLDTMIDTDPAGLAEHLPRLESHGRLLHVVSGRHEFCPASPVASDPISGHPDLPVVGITRASAERYAAWLAMELRLPLRLPTEPEWEKAARGADGRTYPWGNEFDPTFCSMKESTDGGPNLRPVGSCPTDVGPHGLRDMAGNVREWCHGVASDEPRSAICRGGAWYLAAGDCATTSRWLVDPGARNAGIGFRLAADLPSS